MLNHAPKLTPPRLTPLKLTQRHPLTKEPFSGGFAKRNEDNGVTYGTFWSASGSVAEGIYDEKTTQWTWTRVDDAPAITSRGSTERN